MGPAPAERDRLVVVCQGRSGMIMHWLPGLINVMDRLLNFLRILHRCGLVGQVYLVGVISQGVLDRPAVIANVGWIPHHQLVMLITSRVVLQQGFVAPALPIGKVDR